MEHKLFSPILCLAIFLTFTLVSISLPVKNVNNFNNCRPNNLMNTALSRALNDVQNGNAVAGNAPQSGLDGCMSFICPVDYTAVRGPITNAGVIEDVKAKTFFCVCFPKQDAPLIDFALRTTDLNTTLKVVQRHRQRRAEEPRPLVKDINLTYVPPPKTDITPALLAESLSVQPQDTATVGSILPHFQDGVISYGVQLNGLIAATMTLNASTSLPCANIGQSSQAQPDLVLRPKDIDNGTAQPYVPDCNIVAVNMYDPNVIHYWVMDANGSIYSLVGNNKVINIDQLNTTASVSLVLRAKPAGTMKRNLVAAAVHRGAEIAKRALSQPDLHTASMTAEACAAMKCNNNGGKAAVFNPFTKTCWCQDPVYVEIENV